MLAEKVTNAELYARSEGLSVAIGKMFMGRFNSLPSFENVSGVRLDFDINKPKTISLMTGETSHLGSFLEEFDGLRTSLANHGQIDLSSTKIVSLGYLTRPKERWLSITLANDNHDPMTVWVSPKPEYFVTNSEGDGRQVYFSNLSAPKLMKVFDDVETLFSKHLKPKNGVLVCSDAPYAGWQLNKKNRL